MRISTTERSSSGIRCVILTFHANNWPNFLPVATPPIFLHCLISCTSETSLPKHSRLDQGLIKYNTFGIWLSCKRRIWLQGTSLHTLLRPTTAICALHVYGLNRVPSNPRALNNRYWSKRLLLGQYCLGLSPLCPFLYLWLAGLLEANLCRLETLQSLARFESLIHYCN